MMTEEGLKQIEQRCETLKYGERIQMLALVAEVRRLQEREQRFVRWANGIRAIGKHIIDMLKEQHLLRQFKLIEKLVENRLQLSDFLHERAWWQWTKDDAIAAYHADEMTIGTLAYVLDTHIVDAREAANAVAEK